MENLIAWFVDPSGLTPHGFCLLWQPGLIWSYALADLLIGIAYLSIAAALATFARRRREVIFLPLLWMFTGFIGLTGLSHWLDTLTLWIPAYGLEAVVKIATALTSIMTATMMWRCLPVAIKIPSVSEHDITAKALRTSESFLERTGRAARVGGWELEIASSELCWTEETYRIHGVGLDYTPSLATVLDFYPPEARRTLGSAVAQAMAGGPGYDLELPFIKADDTPIWVRTFGTVLFDEAGPVRVTGAIQDVTEQVGQRLAMEAANQRAAFATEAAGIGVWDWNVRTDAIVWDEAMCGLYGLGRCEEINYQTWKDALHPQDRAAAEAALQDGVAGIRPFDTEFRIVLPDGRIRHIRAIARVYQGAGGDVRAMIGVNWDVTEARELAADRDMRGASLATSEKLFRLIAENANDVISLVDADGARNYVSPAVQQVLGMSPEVFRSTDTKDYIHPDDWPVVTETQAALLNGHEMVSNVSFRIINPQRGEVFVEVNAQALRNPQTGLLAGYVSVLRDVTERTRFEAELRTKNFDLDRMARHFAQARNLADQANRAKTRFLAGISHELRTPLNGILGYAQLLCMEGGLTDKQMERVGCMLTAGKHLLEMISGVLDLSEIESEALELQVVPIEIRGVIDACLDIVRPAAEARGLTIGGFVNPSVAERVMTDPKRLRQILLNLCGNAVKYTPQGTLKVEVTTTVDDRAIRIEVFDTGPGISPDRQALLFNDFERLDAGRLTPEEGAGLGLSLAKKLTELMGGSIGYRDNQSGGSVFWFELPYVPGSVGVAQTATSVASDPSAPTPAETLAVPLHVLLADDVLMNRDIAAAFLRSAGHNVICVEGGAEAVAAAAKDVFDLIFMDVRMPDIDGLEATRRIRNLGSEHGDVPIVALTAQAFTEQVEACTAAGMDCHVTKPFTLESLLHGITRGLASRAQRRTSKLADDNGDALLPALDENSRTRLGSNLPIIRREALDCTASLLTPGALRTFLETLIKNGGALQTRLTTSDQTRGADVALVEDVHALAGSAGMFGFERLVFVARLFECAAQAATSDAVEIASDLSETLEASLNEMRRCSSRLR